MVFKFLASHVIEGAFSNADDECLEAMFDEVFDGYECDKFVCKFQSK
jgi:hypothetical protein